jgi:hypothetical protein
MVSKNKSLIPVIVISIIIIARNIKIELIFKKKVLANKHK